MKKIYYNRGFKGLNPVGTSAIVCADNASDAAATLNTALANAGLRQTKDLTASDMTLFELTVGNVEILQDGDY